jgi:hypothetical protein
MQKAGKKIAIVLIVGLVVSCGLYASNIWFYFLTDSAYARLIEAHPTSREEVKKILPEFTETQVRSPDSMNPQIVKSMSGGMSYVRYDKYANGGIDILYDRLGKVVTIWPNYE